MKHTWLVSIQKKLKHRAVRARITLRKSLHLEPSAEQIWEALETKDKFTNISIADIARAYESGDEVSQAYSCPATADFGVVA